MIRSKTIELFIDDQPVLSSLRFSLAIEGFPAVQGDPANFDASYTRLLVIDQKYCGDGLAFLAGLRAAGCGAAAIVLATNPSARLQASVAALGAELIEKPLLGDDLSQAISIRYGNKRAA